MQGVVVCEGGFLDGGGEGGCDVGVAVISF